MEYKPRNARQFLYMGGNKIFAVTFAGIALAFFLAYCLFVEIQSSWTFVRSDILQIISFFIVLYVYLTILICNIRNDSNVYQGILAFIFYIAFSALINALLNSTSYLLAFLFGGGLSWALKAGEAGVGIALYFLTRNYMMHRYSNFKTIRVLSIIFAAILTVYAILALVTYGLAGYNFWNVLLSSGLSLSEAFIGVSIVFTLNRLERI